MKKILVIEDNPDIRESTAEILELADYQVLEAENGRVGVDLAIKNKPDLILCDIMMPELDGYGVLYLLNKQPETARIPFIFLTAKADRVDLRRGMDMGADDYLTKPFDDSELLSAIGVRLAKEQKRQDYYQRSLQQLDDLFKTAGKGAIALKELAAGRKIRQLRKKQVLYYDGDTPQGIYLVLDGAIRTFKMAADGRELMMDMYLPKQYVGIQAVLSEELFTETAEAVEDTAVCLLPKDDVLNLIRKHPELGQRFIRVLTANIRDKEELLLELAYLSVRKRLAQTLVRLKSGHFAGRPEFRISREELASMSGMAVETVSRTLTDFKDEQLIERNGATIRIINVEKLEKMKN